VKYHLGASSDREFDGNKVHLSLTANPSHLEGVNPVVLGKVRAKQASGATEPRRKRDRRRCCSTATRPSRARASWPSASRSRACEGLPHRRHDPLHRQQPDRLHHDAALLALLALSVRRREDGRGADLPRQRRRSGSGGLCAKHRHRIPPEVRQDVVIDMFCYRRFGHNEATSRRSPSR
jgi:2-oxoglutarate dehydrogenase E1 component